MGETLERYSTGLLFDAVVVFVFVFWGITKIGTTRRRRAAFFFFLPLLFYFIYIKKKLMVCTRCAAYSRVYIGKVLPGQIFFLF